MGRNRQVWVFAPHCTRAGDVVTSRYHDFKDEPDSDDYIAVDIETARYHYTNKNKNATVWGA